MRHDRRPRTRSSTPSTELGGSWPAGLDHAPNATHCASRDRRLKRARRLHRGDKIGGMSTLLVDTSGPRRSLLAGHHLTDGGLEWASRLVQAAAEAAGLPSTVASTPPARTAWPVELSVSGQPLLLVDIDIDGVDDSWLDRLELRAARLWRDMTREAELFEPRPWLGALCVSHDLEPQPDAVERLARLVAARVLDSACAVVVDQAGERVGSPRHELSL